MNRAPVNGPVDDPTCNYNTGRDKPGESVSSSPGQTSAETAEPTFPSYQIPNRHHIRTHRSIQSKRPLSRRFMPVWLLHRSIPAPDASGTTIPARFRAASRPAPTNRQPSFGRRVSHAEPRAAEHRTTGSAQGQRRTARTTWKSTARSGRRRAIDRPVAGQVARLASARTPSKPPTDPAHRARTPS